MSYLTVAFGSIQMNERIGFVYFSIDHKIDEMGGNAHTD